MKGLSYIISVVLLSVSCMPSATSSSSVAPDISGHWKLVGTETVEYIPFLDRHAAPRGPNSPVDESYPYEYATNSDLIVSKDSVYYLHYPMELFGAGKYRIDTAHLQLDRHLRHRSVAWPFYINADTMIIYRNDEPHHFQELVYHRTQFDDSIVSILKRDTINYAGLAGKWFLLRSYSYDYGTEYELNFPHKIPDSIMLSREAILSTLNTDKSIEMKTDGVKRKYIYSYFDGELHLSPGAWYRGEDPNIHFWRN